MGRGIDPRVTKQIVSQVHNLQSARGPGSPPTQAWVPAAPVQFPRLLLNDGRIVPELLSVLLQVFAIRKVLLDGASNPAQAQDIFQPFNSPRKTINGLAPSPHTKTARFSELVFVNVEMGGIEPPSMQGM